MYTKEQIRDMIDNFRSTCNTLAMILPDVDSNSIAQYGIEATLPKPQGMNSSKVESVVLAREKAHRHVQSKMDKIAFINNCQDKLNEDDFIFLEVMKGYKRHEILPEAEMNKNTYGDRRKEIIDKLYYMQNDSCDTSGQL
ncbi:hypothetical protein ACWEXP_00895 [Staphylococcus pseudoxylosus]|uniref:Uncharacterized protein n=1 Tax=Staphylococcus pseudoxylosus TaxID=2282419 RepID=A0AAQ0MIP7_9STAP|nr:hypothetical protein [Staphylococcus pseudoxylosus]MCE5003212.1 hypothetical protein [Staphylococcus pseudoxylosus]MRF37140.1 hypothetical protein [Staphylococcus sp. KY49P]RMI84997.1 hypothetical protein D9V42_09070 [Staphylococcus pseudoxylosus]